MKIRVLIIDDEKLARSRLARMLKKYEEVEIAGETGDSLKAAELIAEAAPDAVFLDIHMPHKTGFEVLRELADPPAVVFTTAFDAYALRAFEENTIDYLLKPVDEEKLDRAVAKLVRRFRAEEPDRAGLRRLLQEIERKEDIMRRFPVKTGETIIIIPEERIQFFKAEDKYTFLHTETEAHIIAPTLRELETRLDPAKFLRIHRAYIANLEMIVSIHHWFGGRLLVRTRKKEDIAVGTNYLAKFKEKLHLK